MSNGQTQNKQLLICFAEGHPANPSAWQDLEKDWLTRVEASCSPSAQLLADIAPAGWSGKTSPVSCHLTEEGILVPSSGCWQRAAAVLFERESLRGHSAPGGQTRKTVAALTACGAGTCGADDNQGQAGHLVAAPDIPDIVGQAMCSKWAKGTSGPAGDEHHNLLPVRPQGGAKLPGRKTPHAPGV